MRRGPVKIPLDKAERRSIAIWTFTKPPLATARLKLEKQMGMSQIIKLPLEGFVRLRGILQLIPISKSSWWAGVKSGRYPQSVKLGPHTTAWRVEDIRLLIEQAKI